MTPANLHFNLPDGTPFDLIFVEGGAFDMGDEKGDLWEACRPVHPVKLSSFFIGKHQVTQALWKAVMNGENPSRFQGDLRPVENVSWDDVQVFLKKLNSLTPPPPQGEFRLPTEAEWEYAARGGKYSQQCIYSGSDKLRQVGWYDENSNKETHEVGLKLANELGLYDMSGNVWEWCQDLFDEKYYEQCKRMSLTENPLGADRGGHRVVRGGSYFYQALYCRPASRSRDSPDDRDNDLGFRLALPFQSDGSPRRPVS